MSPVELSKLQGPSAVRALSESDRAQLETRAPAPAPAGAPADSAAAGVSLEVAADVEMAKPPVDAERVAQIREAVRDGSYPLVPTRIADAMIAAQVKLVMPR